MAPGEARSVSVDVRGTTLRGTVTEGQSADGLPLLWGHCMGGSRRSEDAEGYFSWSDEALGQVLRFDARGHGTSGGGPAAEDHAWEALGGDMQAILGDVCGGDTQVFLGGASMGSASALHAACGLGEDRVRGVVLCLPPPCYETRREKRHFMAALGESLAMEGGYDKYVRMNRAAKPLPLFAEQGIKNVWQPPDFDPAYAAIAMQGASLSDFPSKEALRALKVPVLILTWVDDSMHPVESAKILHGLLPSSTLHVAESYSAVGKWKELVADFFAVHAPRPPPPDLCPQVEYDEDGDEISELQGTLLDGEGPGGVVVEKGPGNSGGGGGARAKAKAKQKAAAEDEEHEPKSPLEKVFSCCVVS